jgi:hypothetical protein
MKRRNQQIQDDVAELAALDKQHKRLCRKRRQLEERLQQMEAEIKTVETKQAANPFHQERDKRQRALEAKQYVQDTFQACKHLRKDADTQAWLNKVQEGALRGIHSHKIEQSEGLIKCDLWHRQRTLTYEYGQDVYTAIVDTLEDSGDYILKNGKRLRNRERLEREDWLQIEPGAWLALWFLRQGTDGDDIPCACELAPDPIQFSPSDDDEEEND